MLFHSLRLTLHSWLGLRTSPWAGIRVIRVSSWRFTVKAHLRLGYNMVGKTGGENSDDSAPKNEKVSSSG